MLFGGSIVRFRVWVGKGVGVLGGVVGFEFRCLYLFVEWFG